MRRTSDTSIAISNDVKKNSNSLIQSKHNPRLKEYTTNLIQFKKDNLSIIEENYEPSLGISFLDRKESDKNKNKTELPEAIYNIGQATSRVLATPLDELEVFKNSSKNYVKGGLNLIRLVSKFIRQLKIHSQTFQYKMINENILQLLGDQASNTQLFIFLRNRYFNQNQRQKLDSNCLQLELLLKKIHILNPDNMILTGFKIVLFCLLIVNITYIPLLLFLYEQDFNKQDIHHLLDTLPVVFCMLDCILRFITSFYDEGILYRDIGRIAKHYLKNDFIVDIVSIIPIFTDSLVIQYLTVFRIIKLKLTLATLEEILCLRQQIQGWWELIKSVFFIVYTCHFFACIWYQIGEQGIKNHTNSWLIVKELNNSTWQEQYFFSLYFIVITTLTIGYGDILPCTVSEALFTIFIAFTGCSVLGYTINNIGEIFKNLNEREVKFKQQMKSILQYLKDYNINKNLSLQIRKYFEYHLKQQIENNNEGYQMINQLSKQLREQMQIDLYKKYLIKARFIKDYCSQSTIEKLCQYVKIESYAPESKILNQQTSCEKLYYVLEGELDIYITLGNRNVSICNCLKKDEIIGQWEFVLQNPYLYSVKAVKYTKLLVIHRNDFTKVLKENKEDFEKFNQIKDKLQFSKKQRGNKCFICGWIHYFNKCPFLFFIADREKDQIRDRNQRLRKFEKSRTFQRLNNLRQAALDFIQDSETNDLTLQHLVDLGFNRNDSILHGSAAYLDELIEKKIQSTFKVIENEDDSNHSFLQAPKVVATYKNRSIVFAPTPENDSFLNLKFQSPDQFNRQNSNTLQRPRKQTKELSRLKQSQPKILFSTNKIESKMNFMKRNDGSSNFQSQISSNLNNILTTNNNIYLNQNDNIESQQGSSQHRSEQPSSLLPQQQQSYQAYNGAIEVNFDIDKTQVFSNYFKEGNIYEIVKDLMELQLKQITLKSPKMMQKSIMMGSNKNHKRFALLQKVLKKDSLMI
ncbi:unnamed protein product (macronuclear) [Paramecium tetraurelia]|uniref:Cyclic nucleotide-binding domain-containing protein n=1 Tax=Paramecium tetraurelia TaxID=5888 RepID=A0DDE6_PARTE|nr:uncharacterized protein GSPATT00015922001 [Paramecium tetraurelia]CAK81063.1 unnamed protein product [Paramecium tetraurelia]|eukprot:XP_001448460.1 hypothetical protein (macronuclear) [Paramecium tetraurelia strain d4-2]